MMGGRAAGGSSREAGGFSVKRIVEASIKTLCISTTQHAIFCGPNPYQILKYPTLINARANWLEDADEFYASVSSMLETAGPRSMNPETDLTLRFALQEWEGFGFPHCAK